MAWYCLGFDQTFEDRGGGFEVDLLQIEHTAIEKQPEHMGQIVLDARPGLVIAQATLQVLAHAHEPSGTPRRAVQPEKELAPRRLARLLQGLLRLARGIAQVVLRRALERGGIHGKAFDEAIEKCGTLYLTKRPVESQDVLCETVFRPFAALRKEVVTPLERTTDRRAAHAILTLRGRQVPIVNSVIEP